MNTRVAPSVDTEVEGHSAITGGGIDSYILTLPVILEVGEYLSNAIRESKKTGSFIDQMIPRMRQALYHDLGVRFPGVHVRIDSPVLELEEYTISLNEVPVVRGKVIEGFLLTNEKLFWPILIRGVSQIICFPSCKLDNSTFLIFFVLLSSVIL